MSDLNSDFWAMEVNDRIHEYVERGELNIQQADEMGLYDRLQWLADYDYDYVREEWGWVYE